MDYGLPMNPFFIKIPNCWLEQTNWVDKYSGIWGIFGQTISTHFGTVSPLSIFSIVQTLFLQKIKPFFNDIPNLWGIWGIFGQTISIHLGTVSPLFMGKWILLFFLQKWYFVTKIVLTYCEKNIF